MESLLVRLFEGGNTGLSVGGSECGRGGGGGGGGGGGSLRKISLSHKERLLHFIN